MILLGEVFKFQLDSGLGRDVMKFVFMVAFKEELLMDFETFRI